MTQYMKQKENVLLKTIDLKEENELGVERSDWILIGANIGYENYNDDRCELYDQYSNQSDSGSLTYVIDGMSGEYFIIGEVVQCDPDGYDGFELFNLNVDDHYLKSVKLVKEHILDKFGIEVEPKLIVITHWH